MAEYLTKDAGCGSCPVVRITKRSTIHVPDSESTEVETSTEEDERWKNVERGGDIPNEYYVIQKLMKYIKVGNQTASNVSLCCLKDYDLLRQINQYAILDCNGVEVLVSILESMDTNCILGALAVLADISINIDIRRIIVDLGGIPLICDVLTSSMIDIKTMAAETLANVCKVRLARNYVRHNGGISKLVDLLDVPTHILRTPREQLKLEDVESIDMARAGARALWSLAESKHNINRMCKRGIVPLLVKLLKSVHIDVVLPMMGLLEKCANLPSFKLAIITEKIVPHIVAHLKSESVELKTECSLAISKFAIDNSSRDMIREAGGLQSLVEIIKDESVRENEFLLKGATGAIWMCAVSDTNCKQFVELETVKYLVALLKNYNHDVLANVTGALAELLRFATNRAELRKANGLPQLVALLNYSHSLLLENTAATLQQCAVDIESMRILEELDALRLIWSLMKNDDINVQAAAAHAICPCIRNANDSAELVRSLVGAMDLVVARLQSKNVKVLAAVCNAVSTIAKDRTNLAILTDLQVINRLASLVQTEDDLLREYLGLAIATCADYETNAEEFGRLRTVTPIVGYLVSENAMVHRSTAMALEKLSTDPNNVITILQCGAAPFLSELVGSSNKETQLAAAGCLRNIRELALHTEEYIVRIDY